MDLIIAVLIVIAVQLVMFLYLRGRIHQELNATTLLKDVQDEVDGMVRELNLTAERNIGLLEARIEEMELLLVQADQKVLLLSRELERRDRSAEVYTQLRPMAELPAEPAPASPAPVPVEPDPVVEWKPPVTEVDLRPRTLKERVLALRDQGLDTATIATATGATRGEVELILSLNPPTA